MLVDVAKTLRKVERGASFKRLATAGTESENVDVGEASSLSCDYQALQCVYESKIEVKIHTLVGLELSYLLRRSTEGVTGLLSCPS